MIAYNLVPRFYVALAAAVLVNLVFYGISRSKAGLGIMAVREDESAALASGVGALAHKLLALAIAALFAGVAGGLFAYYHVSYYHFLAFSSVWTFEALLIVHIGGVGSLTGPLLGTLFYVLARQSLATRLPEAHLYVFGAIFIAVVMLWPGGLVEAVRMGERTWAAWRAPAPMAEGDRSARA